jgi:hypothetical protein
MSAILLTVDVRLRATRLTRATCPMHLDAKLSRIFTPRIRCAPIFNLQSEICNFTLPALS